MSIAQNILQQLGGNRLRVMTGAKNFVDLGNGLQFDVPCAGSKANKVKIVLNGHDLYDVSFYKIRGLNVKVVEELSNVYAEDLVERFEEATGLAAHL